MEKNRILSISIKSHLTGKMTAKCYLLLFSGFFFFGTFFFSASPCSFWDLSSPTGIEPIPSALEEQSLKHWTARDVLLTGLLMQTEVRQLEKAKKMPSSECSWHWLGKDFKRKSKYRKSLCIGNFLPVTAFPSCVSWYTFYKEVTRYCEGKRSMDKLVW